MVSQTVEYALRAMSHLASLGGSPANCESIAVVTRVPQGYLSKVMRDLVRADLVHSFRGLHGGFTLARDPRTISVLDIVNAVDPIRRIDCCPLGNPLHATLCPLHKCLDDALAHIERSFAGTNLGSVVDNPRAQGACSSFLAVPLTTQRKDAS